MVKKSCLNFSHFISTWIQHQPTSLSPKVIYLLWISWVIGCIGSHLYAQLYLIDPVITFKWMLASLALEGIGWAFLLYRFGIPSLASLPHYWTFIFLAILLKLSWWCGPPLSSEDVWRYLWDGRLQWFNFPTYTYAPLDPALNSALSFSSELQEIRTQIGHGKIPTIYPPGAQWIFKGLTWGGASLLKMRLGLLCADLLILGALYRLNRLLNLDQGWCILYAFCPLMIFENAHGMHVDFFGACAWIWAYLFWKEEKEWLSGVLWGIGMSIKLLPFAGLALCLGWNWKSKRRLLPLMGGGALSLFFISYPYLSEGMALIDGLRTYSVHWRFNEGAFALVEYGLTLGFSIFDSSDSHLIFICTKIICAFGLSGYALFLIYSQKTLLSVHFRFLGLFLLFSPVLFSWYLTWIWVIFPLYMGDYAHKTPMKVSKLKSTMTFFPLPRVKSIALILWSILLTFSYLPRIYTLEKLSWHVEVWWILLEYSLVWSILLFIKDDSSSSFSLSR